MSASAQIAVEIDSNDKIRNGISSIQTHYFNEKEDTKLIYKEASLSQNTNRFPYISHDTDFSSLPQSDISKSSHLTSETKNKMKFNEKRRLSSNSINASQSIVAGDGVSSFDSPSGTKTVTVTPRDSNGNNVGSGCEIWIQISNR